MSWWAKIRQVITDNNNKPTQQRKMLLVWTVLKKPGKKSWDYFRNWFIPHEGNSHRPRILHHKWLVCYSVFLVTLKVLAIVLPVVLPSSSLYSSAITQQNIIDLTNQTRINLGLTKLKVNNLLTQAAQDKANDMLANQYFAHTSPAGVTPWDWLDKVGYDYRLAGENLAVHYQSSEDVEQGWLSSPTHRANIVNASYQEIGVGIARGQFENEDSIVVVQMFGQPASVLATTNPLSSTATPSNTAAFKQPVVSKIVTAPKTTPLPTKTNNTPAQPVKITKPNTVTTTVPVKPAILPEQSVTPSTIPTNPAKETNGSVGVGQARPPVLADSSVNPLAPVIYDSSLQIKQGKQSYDVSLAVTGATAVALRLGEAWVMMGLDGPGITWRATLPYDAATFSPSGEQLSAVAWGKEGTVADKPLALLAPQTTVQHFYTFNEGSDKYAKFFGFFTVHNLQDKVTQFYLMFMVFLGAALLINIFVKIRIQHYSVISHALAVLALALLLVII